MRLKIGTSSVSAVDDCQALKVAIGSCYAVAVPVTSLLFFFRVRAIFMDNQFVVAFFAFLWLATAGVSATVPLAIFGGHIAETNYCINTAVKSYSSAPLIIATANDTLIFMLIS